MSKTTSSHWRRPTKMYDYNYNVGEHYYKPQLDYLDTKRGDRSKTPPSAKSFAERFVENPVYGRSNWSSNSSSSTVTGSAAENSSASSTTQQESSQQRYGSLNDLRLDLDLSRKQGQRLTFEEGPISPAIGESDSSRRLRFTLGDRLLNAAGVSESGLSTTARIGISNVGVTTGDSVSDDFNETFFQRRKKLGGSQSAEAELITEDPFKSSRGSAALVSARQKADEMMEEMRSEADSSLRLKSRLRAKRQDELAIAESEADYAVSKADQIRQRAKARLAQLEEDFPELTIGSAAARRAAAEVEESHGADSSSSSRLSSATTATKSVRITKRTVKSSYELE